MAMTSPPVVAGIDGSPAAEAAIRWAVAEAISRRTTLSLVHAFSWPGYPRPLIDGELPPGYRAGADQVVAKSLQFARTLAPSLDIEAVHLDGLPTTILLAASEDAGLVVIGTRCLDRGITALKRSTCSQLTATAHCPVVVARQDSGAQHADELVIGYDSSTSSLLALAFGLDHARRHHLKTRIVASPPRAAELQDRDDCQAAELVLLDASPAEQLLRLASDAQLVVVGARGLGGFSGLPLGSVSQTILDRATCPVAVIPAGMIGG
jgi:nucleotide-binding universal stress UspA family protein